jgi:DNA modification methylase
VKYPLSHNRGKKLGDFFCEILKFHVPPSAEKAILDPTCGKKHLWTEILKNDLNKNGKYGRIVFSDIKDNGQEIVTNIKDLIFDHEFDAVIYDPPYFFGYKGSKDPRKKDYGDYAQTYQDLIWFMNIANENFPKWLKSDGKLILKCADQYQTKERRFYPHHYTWINKLDNFKLIDLFIFIHHRLSPTAFQVKNRPNSVIMHTYFLVFNKRTNKVEQI